MNLYPKKSIMKKFKIISSGKNLTTKKTMIIKTFLFAYNKKEAKSRTKEILKKEFIIYSMFAKQKK